MGILSISIMVELSMQVYYYFSDFSTPGPQGGFSLQYGLYLDGAENDGGWESIRQGKLR